ncbi:hypothetical protein RHS04_07963 [Rhizoctonia solani]|uniref:Uncharacterized protein n=1 Tax=Rhizoctonia solani TaxID=456999 RepID=A0A8H7LH13_9AGAM|nr:hypothetical protein RHS04_07963 [Rhizoctonia solani]
MLPHAALIFVASIIAIVRAGNTTCKSTALDWYTESVGETPFAIPVPGVLVSASSKNMKPGGGLTAFLDLMFSRMLLQQHFVDVIHVMCQISCQHVNDSPDGAVGIDGQPDSYGEYLGSCGLGLSMNRTLESHLSRKVCERNIKIPTFAYNITWSDNAWFYAYVTEAAKHEISRGENNTMIESQCSNFSKESKHNTPIAAIIGAVVSGLTITIAMIIVAISVSRRRSYRGVVDLIEDSKPPSTNFATYDVAPRITVTPYMIPGVLDSKPRLSSSRQVTSFGYSKPDLISPPPPIRAEFYRTRPLNSISGGPSTCTPQRHKGSEVLSGASGLGRSPPLYERRDRQES